MAEQISHFQKRNVKLSSKRTSLVLDNYHWAQLDQILTYESVGLDMLVQDIELRRGSISLASACRIFVLMYMTCRLETAANESLSSQVLKANASKGVPEHAPSDASGNAPEDAFPILMLGVPEAAQPSALFQALSLLSRYVAQAS